MPRILSIERIKRPGLLECLLDWCDLGAVYCLTIEDGPVIIKPCLCPIHAQLSANRIVLALNSHKRIYRCPKHGASPRECDCCRDAEDILEEMNRDRPEDP